MLRKYQVLNDFIVDPNADGATEQRQFFCGETFVAEQLDMDGPDGGVVELRLEDDFRGWFDTDCIWPVTKVAIVLAGSDSCIIRVDDSEDDPRELYNRYLLEQGEGAGWINFSAWLRENAVRVCDIQIIQSSQRRVQHGLSEPPLEGEHWRAEQAGAVGPVGPVEPLNNGHWRAYFATQDIPIPGGVWSAGTSRMLHVLTRHDSGRLNIQLRDGATLMVESAWLASTPHTAEIWEPSSPYGGDQEAE